ncbi:MAG: DUF2851 family protein [Bacteroidales bacterium]|nr:DUF2851 family protein [Bacteroidales bacterium]
MSEAFLHFVWGNKLYYPEGLYTNNNELIEVVSPGIHNNDSGPDFFNSQIKINGTLWAGNTEIHIKSSDWYRHGHHLDPAYNNVILHIAEEIDEDVYTADNRKISTLKLPYSPGMLNEFYNLEFPAHSIPCAGKLQSVEKIIWINWLERLKTERLERKSEEIFKDLEKNKNHRELTFFIYLTRHFGFGKNSDPFEQIARSIPFSTLEKCRTNRLKTEALLFGQAGMLNNTTGDDYYQKLKTEYEFIKHKWNLTPINSSLLKLSKIRPQNFPVIRLSLLAGLICKPAFTFSNLMNITDIQYLKSIFQSEVSEYWQSHFSFEKEHAKKIKILGKSAVSALLINVFVPNIFVYGKQNNSEVHVNFAMEILENNESENNSIIAEWEKYGISADNAGTAQALIQLKKEYCDKKKCLYCHIGYQVLKMQK